MKNKKVLLFVIDALSSHVFFPAVEAGKLPHFQQLMAAGQVDRSCTAVFPSITHCALSSLATGTYPDQHGVPGGYWFNTEKEDVVYYIGDFWTILKEGVGKFFTDLLSSLNEVHVHQPTIFEHVEQSGMKAACINHLIHRGTHEHAVNAPLLFDLLPGANEIADVKGPSILFIGDMVHTDLGDDHPPFAQEAGVMRRYGLDDQFSGDVLLYLAKEEALPDFTLTYFMDNDYKSHEVGPQEALPVLEKIDQRLGELFALYGGVEQLLEEFAVVITGDHAQCDIADNESEAIIAVGDLLQEYQLTALGQVWADGDDILACPNMRTLQLYLHNPSKINVHNLAADLLQDERVDQVMWRAELEDETAQGYIVETKQHGRLHFWPSNEIAWRTENHARDEWNRRWQWEGDLATVGGECYRRKLTFAEYPNAFERIACALSAAEGGHVWATSMPGAEFQLESSMVHVNGGSHGSLHRLDSEIPLVLAGAPQRIQLPPATRTVDVLPLCLSILGIQPPQKVGVSHIPEEA